MPLLRYILEPLVWKFYWEYVRGHETQEREILSRLTVKYPDEYLFHNYLAFNCARAELYRDAIDAMNSKAALHPHPIDGYYLGTWYLETQDRARCVELLEGFLRESEKLSKATDVHVARAKDFLKRQRAANESHVQ